VTKRSVAPAILQQSPPLKTPGSRWVFPLITKALWRKKCQRPEYLSSALITDKSQHRLQNMKYISNFKSLSENFPF